MAWTRVACQSNKGPVHGGAFAVTLVRRVVILHAIQDATQHRDSGTCEVLDRRADLPLYKVDQRSAGVRIPG